MAYLNLAFNVNYPAASYILIVGRMNLALVQ